MSTPARYKNSQLIRKARFWLSATLLLSLAQNAVSLVTPKNTEIFMARAIAADNAPTGYIGIVLAYRPGQGIVIREVPSSSPAGKAGLLVDDQIVSIDNVSTSAIGENEAARLIKGPTGTQVKLVIRRGKSLKSFIINRDSSYNTSGYFDSAAYIKQSVLKAREQEQERKKRSPNQAPNARDTYDFNSMRLRLYLSKWPMNNQSYLGQKWNYAISQTSTLNNKTGTDAIFNSQYWATGSTPAEKAADSTIPILYNTFANIAYNNHPEFQINLRKLSEACKRLSTVDKIAVGTLVINTLNDARSRMENYDKNLDTIAFLSFSTKLVETSSPQTAASDDILVKSRSTLTESLSKDGRYIEAEHLAQANIKDLLNKGADSAQVADALKKLAELYKTQRKYNQAEAVTKELLNRATSQHGLESVDTIPSRCQLASLSLIQRHFPEAEAQRNIIDKIMETTISAMPSPLVSATKNDEDRTTPLITSALSQLARSYDAYCPFSNPMLVPPHLRSRLRWMRSSREPAKQPSWGNALALQDQAYRYYLSKIGLNSNTVNMLEYLQELYIKADRGNELLPVYDYNLKLAALNKVTSRWPTGSTYPQSYINYEAKNVTGSLKSQLKKLQDYLADPASEPDTVSGAPVDQDLRRRHQEQMDSNRSPETSSPRASLRTARDEYNFEQAKITAANKQRQEKLKADVEVRRQATQSKLQASIAHVKQLKAQNPPDSITLAMALLDLSKLYCDDYNLSKAPNSGELSTSCFLEAIAVYKGIDGDQSLEVNDALWKYAKLVSGYSDANFAQGIKELIALTELKVGDASAKYSDFSRWANLWTRDKPAKLAIAREIAIAMVNNERKYHANDKEKIISALNSLANIENSAKNPDAEEKVHLAILKESAGVPRLYRSALKDTCSFYARHAEYQKLTPLWNELVKLQAGLDNQTDRSPLFNVVYTASSNAQIADPLFRQCVPLYFKSNNRSLHSSGSFNELERALKNTIKDYQDHNQFAQAEALLNYVLVAEEKAIGSDEPGTNQMRLQLSQVLLQHSVWCAAHGDQSQAKQLFAKSQHTFDYVLRYAIKFNGAKSPATDFLLRDRQAQLIKGGFNKEAQAIEKLR